MAADIHHLWLRIHIRQEKKNWASILTAVGISKMESVERSGQRTEGAHHWYAEPQPADLIKIVHISPARPEIPERISRREHRL